MDGSRISDLLDEQLYPLQRQFFQRQFKLFDKDNSNTIPLANLYEALCMCGLNPNQGKANEYVEHIKSSWQGPNDQPVTVSMPQFLDCVVTELDALYTGDDLKNAFKALDTDAKGQLGSVELRYVLTNFGDKLSVEEMNTFLEQAEASDGLVTYDTCVEKFQAAFLKDM